MKKAICVLALLLAGLCASAQMLNGTDLGQLSDVKYMDVMVSKAGFKSTYFAKADYGQGVKMSDKGFQDENGEPVDFKTPVHVLNWLSKYGWALHRDWEDGAVLHFLMVKK